MPNKSHKRGPGRPPLNKISTAISLDPAIYGALQKLAAAERRSVSNMVEVLVLECVEKEGEANAGS